MIAPYVWNRPDPDWRDQAACRGANPGMFFVEVGTTLDQAKAICMACPVRQECLDEALANNERYGLFGGMSVKERRYERRRRLRDSLPERRVSA